MKVSYIELAGAKHPVCLSMGATKALIARFGSMDAMHDEVTCGDNGRVIEATDAIFSILLKAGRIYASACGEDLPPALPCNPSDLMGPTDDDILDQIFDVMRKDTDREIRVESKNLEATQGN